MTDMVLLSDITYLRTELGFIYLSLVMGLSSRKIVVYALSKSLSTDGSFLSLEMALKELGNTICIIHHSDRGIHYCSKSYVGMLKSKGIRISMSSRG